MNRSLTIKKLAFILGFTSIVGQILLLRELITVFYGNETAYAIILASWLFWVSVGSYTVSLLSPRIKNPRRWITVFLGAVFLILPSVIVTTRFLKQILSIQTGEIVGMIPMSLSSFILSAPLTFFLGGLFTLVCKLSQEKPSTRAPALDRSRSRAVQGVAAPYNKGATDFSPRGSTHGVGTVYIWESIGAAAGGIFFSFVFVHILPAVHLAVLVGAINIIALMSLYQRREIAFKVGVVLCVLTGMAFFWGGVRQIDRATRQAQWKGLELLASEDSIYGNIAMTRLGDAYSLYESGLLSYTTRDELTSETNIHFPLLEHPAPRDVLLIGNGVGGSLKEALKYPSVHVDYLELDPAVIEISKRYLPPLYTETLNDPRVRVIHTDGRLFVKRAQKKYDAVIVNLPDPYTALLNRYYSLEFFKEAAGILAPGGILALSISSSENYLSEEAKDLLRSLHTTLKNVFADVKAIPGEATLFLACGRENVLTYDPRVLLGRLKERAIETKYVREYYVPFQLSADRVFYIEDVLRKRGEVNTDAHPVAYLYDIVLWSTQFNTAFKNMVDKILWIKLSHLLVVPLVIFGLGWVIQRTSPTAPVSLSIMTTGFSEIIFQVIVILAFQTLYGYAYYKIGLIMASFMAGLVGGSFIARGMMKEAPARILRTYKWVQLSICLYPAALPFVFAVFRDAPVAQRFVPGFATAFALLPFVAGLIGGLQYPLALQLMDRKRRKGSVTESAGFLYAIDVLGATLGALLAGMFLIPLWGIYAVAFFCASINTAVLVLLCFTPPIERHVCKGVDEWRSGRDVAA